MVDDGDKMDVKELNINKRLTRKHDEGVDFEVVAAHYCAPLYPKERRIRRAQKFIREELNESWTGTFNELVIHVNRHIRDERLSISPDDLKQVLQEIWQIEDATCTLSTVH